MIWLRSGLILALAYTWAPAMWHTCAWGEINPNPQPAITIAAAVMLLLACVAESRPGAANTGIKAAAEPKA